MSVPLLILLLVSRLFVIPQELIVKVTSNTKIVLFLMLPTFHWIVQHPSLLCVQISKQEIKDPGSDSHQKKVILRCTVYRSGF